MRNSFAQRLLPVVLICVLLSPLLCLAQGNPQNHTPMRSGSIRGSVRDALTHRGMEHIIVVVDAEDSGYGGQAETDSSGRFEVQGLDPSSYQVTVKAVGYVPAVQHVNLSMYPSGYIDFELRPIAGHPEPAVAPEGPDAVLNARLLSVPEKARKEFAAAKEAWQKGKDPQIGIDHLNKATKIYPKFADAYVLKATLDMQQNNPADAKNALDRALELAPKMPEAWFTLGTLQNREKDYGGAEKNLLRGLQLNDTSSEGHYELAKTYWATGRWQEAEPHALKAAGGKPAIAPAHVLLGNIALRKNDKAGALKEFQEYLTLAPNGPMAEGTRAMIKKLQTVADRAH